MTDPIPIDLPPKARSRRVAERCGFSLEGLHHNERRAPDGSLRHTCVYALLRPAP